jgi:hypothetical protein
MDANQFDALVKTWTGIPRRRLLRGVMAASLSGLGPLHVDAAHFECRHVGARCKSKDQCCSGVCRGKDRKKCRAHHTGICKTTNDTCTQGTLSSNECGTMDNGDTCYCYITTGGAPYCVGGSAGFDCEKDEECYPELSGGACIACDSPFSLIPTACTLPCDNPD